MSDFWWKGREINTYDDVMSGIQRVDSPEEAQEFMEGYRRITDYADQNIGYMTGYFDRETGKRMREWFNVDHPVFGRGDPTPEEAFAMGQEWGRKMMQDDLSGDAS